MTGQTMLAGALMDIRHMAAVEREIPQPKAGEALIRVTSAGICGSDLGAYKYGGHVPKGTILGHEFSGEVVALGDGVEGVAVGDRVTVNPMQHLLGIFTDGAFAEYVLLPDARLNDSLFLLTESVSDLQGALIEPLAVSLRGINRCGGLSPDTKVVIQGLGTIGLCALLVLRQRGVRNIVAVDAPGVRLDLAASLGATTHALGGSELGDTVAAVHGKPARPGRFGVVDLVVDATGNGQAFNTGLKLLRRHGRMLVLGSYPGEINADINTLVANELEVIGSLAYDEEFPAALRLVETGQIDVLPLVSHHFPLRDISKAFEQSLNAAESIKVIIDVSGSRAG